MAERAGIWWPGCAQGQADTEPTIQADIEAESAPCLSAGQGNDGADFATELWATQRITALIEHRLGITYHRHHVGKLLHKMGSSHRKPASRAVKFAETAITEWKRTVRPRAKNAARLAVHVVFVDESGFLLIPSIEKCGPCGADPPLALYRYWYCPDRISGIAVSPKRFHCTLYCHLYEDNIQGKEVMRFLPNLFCQVRGRLIAPLDWLGRS